MEFDPPPVADFDVDIGQSELDFYRRNGYLVCGDMTTPDELAWLGEVYGKLFTRRYESR